MWAALAASVDFFHAFVMAAWVLAMPLLFVRRWPRARFAYACFAVTFIVLSQASMYFLNECFLTTIARWCWQRVPEHIVSREWFTVRVARFVFGMSPSHRAISRATEALVLVTAIGALVSVVRGRRQALRAGAPSPSHELMSS